VTPVGVGEGPAATGFERVVPLGRVLAQRRSLGGRPWFGRSRILREPPPRNSFL